ncbi:MAG: hypothetical protein Q9226_008069 [Calogaya cf. arnoldii]
MTLLVCAYVGMFLASLFECWPIEKNWEPTMSRGHCLKPKAGTPYVSGVINVVSDIVVLVLPIPVIWSLKMNLRRKLRVIAIFSVATFAVIASIIRLARTSVLFVDRDRTWNVGKIEIWAVLEVNVGLICACSLAFPAFLDRYKAPFLAKFQSYTCFFGSTANIKLQNRNQHANPSMQTSASDPCDHQLFKPDYHSKSSGDSSSYPMSEFAVSEAPESLQHLTRRADIEPEGDRLVFPEAVHRPREPV